MPARSWDDEDHPVPTKPLAQLEQEICELAGHIAAATCRWLLLVAEFEKRDGWCVDGVLSMAHWLSWRCGFGLRAAREHVRIARALIDLPLTRDAFMMGRLSYSKVRALTRIATRELEPALLDIAQYATGAHIDKIVAGYRKGGRLTADQKPREYYARWDWDDNGDLIVHARLSPVDGARYVAALLGARDELRGSRDTDRGRAGPTYARGEGDGPAGPPYGDVAVDGPAGPSQEKWSDRDRISYRTSADPLVHMAERAMDAIAAGTDVNERHLVLAHVDVNTLRTGEVDEDSICELNNGWAISPTLARLLTCDGSVARAIVDADGKILDVGRKSRVVSKRLDRALRCRDRHCRAPGCTNPVFSWHHVEHWADDGPTDKTNLVGLCKAHHHAVHDRGFIITTSGDEVFRFCRPDLTPIPDVPETQDVWGALEDQQPHLAIDADTVGGNWQGDKLHLHYVVDALMRKPRAQVAS
jgi:hypothetical protein